MTPETKRAIARIFARARDATTVVGTGFLVSSDGLVLTAFHVIGNRQAALQQGLPAVHSAIELQFDGEIARIACELVDGCFNPLDDWALLRLARVPANLTPIPLGLISDLDTGSLPRIETYGYPLVSRTSDAGMVVSGLIQDKDARYQGAWAYQLFSESAGAGLGTNPACPERSRGVATAVWAPTSAGPWQEALREAAGRHKHRAAYAHPAYAHVVRTPQVGPIWAGPNQCWTDEGYGRYAPCSGRR